MRTTFFVFALFVARMRNSFRPRYTSGHPLCATLVSNFMGKMSHCVVWLLLNEASCFDCCVALYI